MSRARRVTSFAGVVRTVWIHRTGATEYVQRHLPTGGVEIHFPLGDAPQLLGPLTGPVVEVVPANTTIVGVRFFPGAAPPFPTVLDDLVDQRIGLADLWGSLADRLVEGMAGASTHAGAPGSCSPTCCRSTAVQAISTGWSARPPTS